MDELVLAEIGRQVYVVDHTFIDSRIRVIEKSTQWNSALYLNWRRHLLGKKIKQNKLVARNVGDRRDEYAKWRRGFLERKYGSGDSFFPRSVSSTSLKSSASSNSLYSDPGHMTDESPPASPRGDVPKARSQSLGAKSTLAVPEFHPSSSRPVSLQLPRPDPKQYPSSPRSGPEVLVDYAFSGMHHIFAETTHPITCVEFGWNDSDVLAFGSQEGRVYLCSAAKSPRVLHVLKGHTSSITALRWSSMNDMLVSTSTDSVRMWDRKTGLPIRTMKEPALACCLNPTSDNLVITADNKNLVKVFNVTTGKCVVRVKSFANITCMQFDSLGHFLFAGDEKGYIEIFKYIKDTGMLQLISKTALSKLPIINLAFKGIYANKQFSPSLLVNVKDNSIKVLTMKMTQSSSSLMLSKEFHIQNKKDLVKSAWCPLADSTSLVTGSENGNIAFYDITRKDKPINTLLGHSGTVSAVSWAQDESLLASGDVSGVVILWSRKYKA